LEILGKKFAMLKELRHDLGVLKEKIHEEFLKKKVKIIVDQKRPF